jgi:hypothetical protein
MRFSRSTPLVLSLSVLVGFAACSSKSTGELAGGAQDAGGDSTTSIPTGGDDSGQGPASSGGTFTAGEGGGPQATDCKGGHYSGSFTGNYTSYLTSLFGLGGIPLKVTGDVELDLQETMTMTQGEIAMSTFNIANGTISGFANNVFPYHCDMVGTLDCNTKKLVGGGLRNCWYCVGLFVSLDGGNCGTFGHFAGPLNADYDGKTFSFINGSWNGSEEAATDDAGTLVLGDGGGINDAGLYVGPGNYGGAGNWNASYTTDF